MGTNSSRTLNDTVQFKIAERLVSGKIEREAVNPDDKTAGRRQDRHGVKPGVMDMAKGKVMFAVNIHGMSLQTALHSLAKPWW